MVIFSKVGGKVIIHGKRGECQRIKKKMENICNSHDGMWKNALTGEM